MPDSVNEAGTLKKALLALAIAWLPILTTLAGGLWAVYLFVEQQENDTKSRYFEARKPYREKQLDLYFQMSEITAKMIWETPADPEWKNNSNLFKKLFWQVSLVGEDDMNAPLIDYLGQIKICEEQTCQNAGPYFASAHERLMKAFRRSLDKAWRDTPH